MPRIAVLALDYDDCLVRKFYKNHAKNKDKPRKNDFDSVDFNDVVNEHNPPLNKTKWKKCLLTENDPLIHYVGNIAPYYDKIVLCIGSNRQNPYIDTTNSCKEKIYSGSAYEGLELFKQKLEEELGVEIELNSTTTADYFHGRQEGETFQRTLAWLREEEKPSEDLFKDCPNDRTKVSLHYRLMHLFASKYPEAEIDYYAVDDGYQGKLQLPNPGIIDALNYFYTKFSDLIPRKTTLFTVPYKEGQLDTKLIHKMRGEGGIDLDYEETMKTMMVNSLAGKNQKKKNEELFQHNSCDTWQAPFIEEFIAKHQASYNSGFWGGFFNKTNLKAYDSLTVDDIYYHAQKTTFFGFKNRTRLILEEMNMIDENEVFPSR